MLKIGELFHAASSLVMIRKEKGKNKSGPISNSLIFVTEKNHDVFMCCCCRSSRPMVGQQVRTRIRRLDICTTTNTTTARNVSIRTPTPSSPSPMPAGSTRASDQSRLLLLAKRSRNTYLLTSYYTIFNIPTYYQNISCYL